MAIKLTGPLTGQSVKGLLSDEVEAVVYPTSQSDQVRFGDQVTTSA